MTSKTMSCRRSTRKTFKILQYKSSKDCNQPIIQKLQMFLQTNNIWVKKHRNTTVPKSLFNTLQEKDLTKWTELEIREHMATKEEFNSGRITYLFKTNFTSTNTIKTPISISVTTPLRTQIPTPTT